MTAKMKNRLSGVKGRMAASCLCLPVVAATVCGSGPALADSFYLKDGSEVQGQIIQGLAQSIMIRSDVGTVVPLTIGSVERAQVDLHDNKQIEGKLVAWKDGRCILLSADGQLITIAENRIVSIDAMILAAEPAPAAGTPPAAVPRPPGAKEKAITPLM